jgi:hypothetical protein
MKGGDRENSIIIYRSREGRKAWAGSWNVKLIL